MVSDDIAAVVFLYNFDKKNIENICSYSKDIGFVYAFDNSEHKNIEAIEELKRIPNLLYIDGNGNRGLSYPINYAADLSIKDGYKWLITFDQDSIADEHMIPNMIEFANNFDKINRVGIISPSINMSYHEFDYAVGKFSYNSLVIQSGAMHNLVMLKSIGGYDENLFIDQVDFDYCIRLRYNKYTIVKVNSAVLKQNVNDDDIKIIRQWGRRLYINKYSPIRYYHITRNILYCIKKHKKTNSIYCHSQKYFLQSLIMTIPYDNNKLKKMKAVLLGIFDFAFKRMGKCKWKI